VSGTASMGRVGGTVGACMARFIVWIISSLNEALVNHFR